GAPDAAPAEADIQEPAGDADGEASPTSRFGGAATTEGGDETNTEGDDSPSDKVVRRQMVHRQASKEIIEGIRRKRSTSIQSSTHDDDAQDKIDAEEARWRIPASFFYDPSAPELNPPLEDRELPRQGTRAARFM
ncbi:Eml6, partial [Symbiodinium necroappetens]